MTLPASGVISINDLRTEFSATGQKGLADFYRAGTYVPDTPANAGVPLSGQIALNNFYNASGAVDSPTLSKRKTADTARTNNTLTDDPELTVSLTNGITYALQLYMKVSSVSTSSPGNIQFTFTTAGLSGSTFIVVGVGEKQTLPQTFEVVDNGGKTVYANAVPTFTGYDSTDVVAVTNEVGYIITGLITASASGAFTLKWAQNTTAGSNATSVLAGSWMELWAL